MNGKTLRLNDEKSNGARYRDTPGMIGWIKNWPR